MKPTQRMSHKHKQIPDRIKKMTEIANELGYILRVEWHTTPHEWLRCELNLWWAAFNPIIKLPLWEMERYLEDTIRSRQQPERPHSIISLSDGYAGNSSSA